MSAGAVAERYARALFELALESSQLEPAAQQISDFAAVYVASADLRSVVDNPVVPEVQRTAVLEALVQRLGLAGVVRNTVRLLARRRRLAVLPELARALRRLADEKTGVLRAQVTSAEPLGEGEVQRLIQRLERATRRRIVLDRRVDPALIAGLVTRIGDQTIDGSLQGRLAALERRLLQS